MAVNPMQRKAYNSFLLGMLLTLLVTGTVIVLLVLNLMELNEALEADKGKVTYGYVISSTVKSGTEITVADIQGIELKLETESAVLYTGSTTDSTGQTIPDSSGTFFPAGLKAKVDLSPGTVITSDITYEDELVANDVRKQEYNIITLPTQIMSGEYVDIRLRLPTGEDYIVVSHKQVELPMINGIDSENCVWVELSEIEILNLSCAIVEAYQMNGAKLYATTYVEAGMQEAAKTTYLPSDALLLLIDRNQNILQTAKNELFNRSNDSTEKGTIRNPINAATNNEDAEDNVIDRVEEEVQGLISERENYLDSLGY